MFLDTHATMAGKRPGWRELTTTNEHQDQNMKTNKWFTTLALAAVLAVGACPTQAGSPLGTAFSYQGKLTVGTNAANGLFDLRFALYDAMSSPTNQIGPALTNAAIVVSNGTFTVLLDFGSVFDGDARWLEIGVRTSGGTGGTDFTTLVPRQPLTPCPYALYVRNAGTATTAASASTATVANSVAAGSVTSAGIASGQLVKSVNSLKDDVMLAAGANLTLTPSGQTLALASPTDWHVGGNVGTVPGTSFVGTTDAQPLEFRAANQRALRLEYNGSFPNVIGGSAANAAGGQVQGGTIAGGDNNILMSSASGTFGSTIGGGTTNRIGNGAHQATIAGGNINLINTNAVYSAIGGGLSNAIGANSYHSTIAGGYGNTVGTTNAASDAAIGGGFYNLANNWAATVPGGYANVAGGNTSFAAGNRAKAINDGAFVWADTLGADFSSVAQDEFAVRARGGVRFVTSGAGVQVDGQTVLRGQVGPGQIAPGAIAAGDLSPVLASNTFWRLDGNAGTTPGTQFLGTSDNQPLEVKVNNVRALRLEPGATAAPNVIGGGRWNSVDAGISGATIAGGGATSFLGTPYTNRVGANFGTIGGGAGNNILLNAYESVIAGGYGGKIGTNAHESVIGGGLYNAIGGDAFIASIGGGQENTNNGAGSVIGGGLNNLVTITAQDAAIAGGAQNQALANFASVPGGYQAKARNYGQLAYASGSFSGSAGEAQAGLYVLRNVTQNSNAELFLDGAGSRMMVPTNTTWAFHILIVGRSEFTGGDFPQAYKSAFEVTGMVSNDRGVMVMAGPTSVTLPGSATPTLAADVRVDQANHALIIMAGNSAFGTVRWVATVRTSEVLFP
jgi:hypothetical protein